MTRSHVIVIPAKSLTPSEIGGGNPPETVWFALKHGFGQREMPLDTPGTGFEFAIVAGPS